MSPFRGFGAFYVTSDRGLTPPGYITSPLCGFGIGQRPPRKCVYDRNPRRSRELRCA
jgi:hypothetical protein